jgi:hypothetical protein
LQRAGARQVTLLTLARADRRPISDPLLVTSDSPHESAPHEPYFSGRSEDA